MEFIYKNLDKVFPISFTMLAFMITALTIIQMLNSGRIQDFKEADLLKDVLNDFNKALKFHFISGIYLLIIWFIQISNGLIQQIFTGIGVILFLIAFWFTYLSYKILIYFMKKQL